MEVASEGSNLMEKVMHPYVQDAEKCIKIDPTFSKWYSRKIAVQFFIKEYENSMDTYQ